MVSPRLVISLAAIWTLSGTCLAQPAAPERKSSTEPTENASVHTPSTQPGDRAQPPQPVPRLSPLRRGDILMARKMYRDAIETYREGIQNVAVIYNKIGIAYHQLNDFRTALENYNMALRLNPRYAEAINNVGTIYYAEKKPKRAIKEYKKALDYAPRSASIYSNLGTAYFARKKYKQAFSAYQEALNLDPDVFEHRNVTGSMLQERNVDERAKFHFYLAKTYAKAGMVDRALSYMRKALEEGFKNRKRFLTDPEFQALQNNQEFQALLAMKPRVL